MRAPLIAFLFLLFSALYVSSIPLTLNLDLPADYNQADGDRLIEANRIANLQIDAMHKVLQNPSQKKNKKILRQTFGKNFDYNAIKRHVDDLKTGTVKVSDVNSAAMPGGVRAKTSNSGEPRASVSFGPDYHDPTKMSDNGRAGTLIHEAAHALFGAKDYFAKDTKQPISKSQYKKNLGLSMSGYMAGADYHKLKGDGFSQMHKNADSWKAFGYHALNGKPHDHLNMRFPLASPATSSRSPQRAASGGRSQSPAAGPSRRKGSPSPSRGRTPQRAASHGRSKSPTAISSKTKGSPSPSIGRSPRRAASRGQSKSHPVSSSKRIGSLSPSKGRSPRRVANHG